MLNDIEINYLYENASIMSINPQNRTYYNLSTDEYESIVIFPLSKNAVSDIVEGSSNLSNGGLICPVVFAPLSGVDGNLEKVAKTALEQIDEKKYYKKLVLDKVKDIRKVSIVFSNKGCIVR